MQSLFLNKIARKKSAKRLASRSARVAIFYRASELAQQCELYWIIHTSAKYDSCFGSEWPGLFRRASLKHHTNHTKSKRTQLTHSVVSMTMVIVIIMMLMMLLKSVGTPPLARAKKWQWQWQTAGRTGRQPLKGCQPLISLMTYRIMDSRWLTVNWLKSLNPVNISQLFIIVCQLLPLLLLIILFSRVAEGISLDPPGSKCGDQRREFAWLLILLFDLSGPVGDTSHAVALVSWLWRVVVAAIKHGFWVAHWWFWNE